MGIIHLAKGSNTVRSVFIVDPKGILRAMIYYPQELGRNVGEILRAVEGLRVAEDEGVAMPPNWPKNRLLGSNVIIPPAQNIDAINERMKKVGEGKYLCMDWWLCHKPWYKEYRTTKWREI